MTRLATKSVCAALRDSRRYCLHLAFIWRVLPSFSPVSSWKKGNWRTFFVIFFVNEMNTGVLPFFSPITSRQRKRNIRRRSFYYQRSILSSSTSHLSHGKNVVDEKFSSYFLLTELTLSHSGMSHSEQTQVTELPRLSDWPMMWWVPVVTLEGVSCSERQWIGWI